MHYINYRKLKFINREGMRKILEISMSSFFYKASNVTQLEQDKPCLFFFQNRKRKLKKNWRAF